MKIKVSLLLFIFVILWRPFYYPIQGSINENTFSTLEEKLESIRSAFNIPTIHAGFIKNTELIWLKGFGNQTDPTTIFPIASLHKMFVGTAILQLYEQKIVDLDSDINDYLPFDVDHPDYPEEMITLRMLLTHTSGLASTLDYEFYWDTEGYLSPEYRSDYNPAILNMSLGEYLNESFTPGGYNYNPDSWLYKPNEQYSYSNPGFKLMQYLIECLTEQSFEEYIQENIFEPCEMVNSGINISDLLDNHATPYTRRFGTDHELPLYSKWMIKSTVTDLSHFLIAHLNGGSYQGRQMLLPSTVEMMHKPRIKYSTHRNPLLQDVDSYDFYQHSYGLGWSHFHDDFAGHGGSTPGFISVLAGRKNSIGGSNGLILFMNINAILGFGEDIAEVHLAYKKLVNTILFELDLIPTINQELVNYFIFFLTIWLTFVLFSHYAIRIVYKQKDPSKTRYSRGNISYSILFLVFSVFGIINIVNFFYLYNWMKLLLFLPIIGYLGIVTAHYFKDKGDLPPYFSNTRITNIIQLYLAGSLIGLTLYNQTNSLLPTIITTLLCFGSILLILIDSFLIKEKI